MAHDPASLTRPPDSGRCVVIVEGPHEPLEGTAEYSSRALAEAAIRQQVAHLRARGAMITGDMERGYTAVWQETGHQASLRITLGQVQ
jgi:hypothetical protein